MLTKKIFLAVSLLIGNSQAAQTPIPNSGKFFYATLQMGDATSSVDHMFMEVLIGVTDTSQASQKYQLALSTEKSYLDVFSASCPNKICDVKQKFNKDLSMTYTPSNENLEFSFKENAAFSENTQVTLTGGFGADDFRIRMNGFNRETVLPNLDFASLICSSCEVGGTNYQSSFDGWLGIAPYNRKSKLPDINNFMWQLENVQEMIDNQVVMLNIDVTKGNSSMIKFGGYDTTSSLHGGFNVFKTGTVGNNDIPQQNKHLWNVEASNMLFLQSKIATNVNIVFSPDRRFLYMPPKILRKFQINAFKTFGSIKCESYSSTDGLCSWKKQTCKNVLLELNSQNKAQPLVFDMLNEEGEMWQLKFNIESLLVPGNQVGGSTSECHLGAYSSYVEDNVVHLGVQMLQEVMVVFDNSQDDGPRIGIEYGEVGGALNEAKANIATKGDYLSAASSNFKENDMSVIGLDFWIPGEKKQIRDEEDTHYADFLLEALFVFLVFGLVFLCFFMKNQQTKKSDKKQWAEATQEEAKQSRLSFTRTKPSPQGMKYSLN